MKFLAALISVLWASVAFAAATPVSVDTYSNQTIGGVKTFAQPIRASIFGNASTAGRLARVPAQCANGQVPTGVDARGNVVGCVFMPDGQRVDVRDPRFGAHRTDEPGYSTFDSTAAINAAIVYAAAHNVTVVAEGIYNISSKIILSCNADMSNATFNIIGTPAVAVEISTGTADNPTDILSWKYIYPPNIVSSKAGTGWAGQGTGLRVVNLYSSELHVNHVQGFAVGLQMTAYSAGNVYNNIFINHLDNNKVNLQIVTGDSGGWVNENNFFGGRFGHNSNEGTGVSGARHIQIVANNTHLINQNVFYKPSLEGDVKEYNAEIGGVNNAIMYGRWESSAPNILYVDADSSHYATGNVVMYGYKSDQIQVTNGSYSRKNPLFTTFKNFVDGGDNEGINFYKSTSSSAYPIFTLLDAGANLFVDHATDWRVQFGANSLQGKNPSDTTARINLDFTSGRSFWDSNNPQGGMIGRNNSSSAYPFLTLLESSVDINSDVTNTWSAHYGSQWLEGKRSADAYPRIQLDYINGAIHLGGGSAAPDVMLRETDFYVNGNIGNNDVTLTVGSYGLVIPFATTFTANHTVTLSTGGSYITNGSKFIIVRTGLGNYSLNVGGLVTIPANTSATATVMFNGTTWILTNYAPLTSTSGVTPGTYSSANITVNAYGQITAAANGAGASGLVASVPLTTGKTTAITPTTLYTPLSTGMFRMCGGAIITSTATSGNLNPYVSYNNGTSTHTPNIGALVPVATSGADSAINASTTATCVSFIAAAGQAIQYAIAFSSVSGTPTYSYYFTLEQLQ